MVSLELLYSYFLLPLGLLSSYFGVTLELLSGYFVIAAAYGNTLFLYLLDIF